MSLGLDISELHVGLKIEDIKHKLTTNFLDLTTSSRKSFDDKKLLVLPIYIYIIKQEHQRRPTRIPANIFEKFW